MEVNDGTSTQRYCHTNNCGAPDCASCDYCGSTPDPVTGTIITVKLYTTQYSTQFNTRSGFFAVVTGDVTVVTDVTGESGVGKCIRK